MQRIEQENYLVELFKIPFFNYLYLHITAGSLPHNMFSFDQHYTFYFCLIPAKEEIGKVRMTSQDKEGRIETILSEHRQPLKVNLKKAGIDEFTMRGDPEPIVASNYAFTTYDLARLLWLLSEPPIFSLQASCKRTAFRISSITRRTILQSDRNGVSEKYSIIFGAIILELKRSDIEKANVFYPSNFGIKPPKFYSVPCSTYRITSGFSLEKIPFSVEFTEETYKECQDIIGNSSSNLYLASMFVISSREWDEFTEPDYNVVVQLTPCDNIELLSVAFGRNVQKSNKYLNVKVIGESLNKQIRDSTGHDMFSELGSNEIAFKGLGRIERVGSNLKISFVTLSTVARFLEMASQSGMNGMARDFFHSPDKIPYLETLREHFIKNRNFGLNGELLSPMIRTYLTEFFSV